MVDLVCYQTNLLFYDIPLLYCYTNLNSTIICCLSSGDMYLFFGTSISLLASSFFERVGDFQTLVIFSAIFLPIKLYILPILSPVAFAAF